MLGLTNIRVQMITRDKLKSRGQKSESYDDIIRRLLVLTTKPTKHDLLKAEAFFFLEDKFGCKDIDFEVKRTLIPSNKGVQLDVLGFSKGKSYAVECTTMLNKNNIAEAKRKYFKLVDFLFMCYRRSGKIKFIQIKDKGFEEVRKNE